MIGGWDWGVFIGAGITFFTGAAWGFFLGRRVARRKVLREAWRIVNSKPTLREGDEALRRAGE